MELKGLTQYLNELRVELQEMYEDLDNELRNTDNQELIEDGYHGVTKQMDEALNNLDVLINDIDNGFYTRDSIGDEDYGTLEVED